MTDILEETSGRSGARRSRQRGKKAARASARQIDYHNLSNPFPPINIVSDDQAAAIHDTALRALEELGMKVLLPEARDLFRKAGARLEGDMVFLGRELVEEAIRTAPKSYTMRAGVPEKDLTFELGRLIFLMGAGCPHATDLVRGRRPGLLRDYEELVRIADHYDVIQTHGPFVEPQDVPINVRHYALTRPQLVTSNKVPFMFSRGTPQSEDIFEMIRIARGLSREEFEAEPRTHTIVNTNSPRQLDIPMAQGLIDMARAGQMTIITPFTLMGAMAPVSVAGAATLSHAEAMAAITLTQVAKPGAPILYGTFTSNVDMKSGAPAFGTPENVKASLLVGQLARKLGLPWRCAAGSAANVSDVQAAHETEMSAWGSVLAGATMVVHAAGWLEGGLSISYEKVVTDMEMCQTFAELCAKTIADDAEIGFEALKEVQPGGHFFAAQHTMERYETVFYEPMVADWSNFGSWTENGSIDASTRATKIWQDIVAQEPKCYLAEDRLEELDAFIAKRKEAGGAAPVS